MLTDSYLQLQNEKNKFPEHHYREPLQLVIPQLPKRTFPQFYQNCVAGPPSIGYYYHNFFFFFFFLLFFFTIFTLYIIPIRSSSSSSSPSTQSASSVLSAFTHQPAAQQHYCYPATIILLIPFFAPWLSVSRSKYLPTLQHTAFNVPPAVTTRRQTSLKLSDST